MKRQFYLIMLLQLGIFLSYDFLFTFFDYSTLFFLTIIFHSISLILFSIFYFKRNDALKAFSFLIPFFVVLLIGIGSCSGMIAMMSKGVAEGVALQFDSVHQHRREKNGDTSRVMGHEPNYHKGQKESGIPGRRYKWLKKKPK